MAVRLTILGSGSGGNSAIVATSRTCLLLDVGFGKRDLARRMAAAGEVFAPDAILITHEHTDHIAGLARLAQQLPRPVYLNAGTAEALAAQGIRPERQERFVTGEPFAIGDFEIVPFAVSHDAAEPVAFRLTAEGVAIAFVTDLGYLSPEVKAQLRGCHVAVLESNHDLELLKDGPYPWALKQRVLGRRGHLSNDTVAEFLRGDFDGSPAHLVLAHISENNNLPELARLSAQRALAGRFQPQLHTALQDQPLPSLQL